MTIYRKRRNPEQEEWKSVIGFEEYYSVSSLGLVRSIVRKVSWQYIG